MAGLIDTDLIERKWWRRWGQTPGESMVYIEVGADYPTEIARVYNEDEGDLEGISRFISNAPTMYRLIREAVFNFQDDIDSKEWIRDARDLVSIVEGDEDNYKYIMKKRERKMGRWWGKY